MRSVDPSPYRSRAPSPERCRDERVQAGVAAAFALAAFALAAVSGVASDEGRLTYLGAQITADDLPAGMFLQRLHPSLSVLYLPTAFLGWESFVCVHIALATLGVLAIGRWCAALGGVGWLASLTFAASPIYLYGAAVGLSNVDGLALLAAALWLLERPGRGARVASGALLGFLLWARYEFAVFIAAALGWTLLRDRRREAPLGAALYALVYLGLGGLYHHDPLWFLHHRPMDPVPVAPLSESYRVPLDTNTMYRAFGAWALVSGAIWTLFTPAAFARAGYARAIAAASVALLLAFSITPLFGLDGPEISPRYHSVALPGVALAMAFAGAAWSGRRGLWLDALPVGAFIAALVTPSAEPWRNALAGAALGPLIARSAPTRFRVALLVALAALPGIVVVRYPKAFREFESQNVPVDLLDAVLAEAAAARPRRVLTNVQTLVPRLHAAGLVEARYLPSFDTLFHLHQYGDHENGQYAAVMRSARAHNEGGSIWPCELPRTEFRVGDLLVLGVDWRTDVLVPRAVWAPWTERARVIRDVTILRVTRDHARVALPTPPAWVDRRWVDDPCRAMEQRAR